MSPIIIACIIGGITAILLFMLLFGDWQEFKHSIKFWCTPEIISALRGQYYEDVWAECKLIIFVGVSLFAGFSAYVFFS